MGLDLLSVEVWKSQAHHAPYDSSGRVIGPSQSSLPDNIQHSQQTYLYLTTHNTHNRQTSTWQHTTLTTDRPLPHNTQHSQQTDLYLTTHNTHNRQTSTSQHTTLTTDRPLPHNTQHSPQTDLYLTTHNNHNRQTSTSQQTTLTTDKLPRTQKDSNRQSQQASCCRPRGHRDRLIKPLRD